MQWDDFVGHEQQRAWFRTALAHGRMATSFLFVGPSGIGKRTFARLIAKSLLCRASEPQELSPCGVCEDCAQVDASTHPDLLEIKKPADKAFLPIELLIGEREKRMREGLCHDISLKPFAGRRKVAILDDADTLNNEGANCLLKTLEEPPLNSVLILVGSSLQRQLPTIRSRCQAIIFQPLFTDQVKQLLLRHQVVTDPEQARLLAHESGGSLTDAGLLADPELSEFREELLQMLSKPELPMAELVKSCASVVDAAGKEARVKRERLKLLLRMSGEFYRAMALYQSSHQEAELEDAIDGSITYLVRRLAQRWKVGVSGAIQCWNRCLHAMEEVDRNANQTALLEAWAADLAKEGGY